MCTFPYVKQIASGNLLCDRGNPKLVLCDNLEGWDEERGLRGRKCMSTCGLFMLMCGRDHHDMME